jgi:ribosomal protein S2
VLEKRLDEKKGKKNFYNMDEKIVIQSKKLLNCYFLYKPSENINLNFITYNLFEGDHFYRTHFSQYFYLLGFKNNLSFYDIRKSLVLFSNAVRFLKQVNTQKDIFFIFVGAPLSEETKLKKYSKRFIRNSIFFPNGTWHPGYISKSTLLKTKILVIYNINLNHTAYREALKTNIPVVGFATPSCDIRGLDYPILFNFRKSPIWYIKLLLSIFRKR